MRILLVFIALLSFSLPSLGNDRPLLIISDIDGTLRTTDMRSKFAWIPVMFKILLPLDRPFTMMPELLEALDEPKQNKTTYLTATPWVMWPFQAAFLKHRNFPKPFSLTTRFRFLLKRSQKYKQQRIDRLLKKFPDHEVLLIGDNTHSDPEAFRYIQEAHPDRTIHSFVHIAFDDTWKSDWKATPFLSAGDLASHLQNRGLLNQAQVESIREGLEHEQRRGRLFAYGEDVSDETIERILEKEPHPVGKLGSGCQLEQLSSNKSSLQLHH